MSIRPLPPNIFLWTIGALWGWNIMNCGILMLYYNSTIVVIISNENEVEYSAEILIIICIVWIYNIGCCTFRWPCESLWAPGFLGDEELATSGGYLIQFSQFLSSTVPLFRIANDLRFCATWKTILFNFPIKNFQYIYT